MKKLTCLLIVFCHLGMLAVPLIFADSAPPAPSTPEVWRMFSFPGIQTGYTAIDGTRANSTIRPMVNQLADVRAQVGTSPLDKELLVGHSQGGVRALAFARLTENKTKVSAVITVNSPVKGHSGLDYTYETNKKKVVETLWPVLDGLYALEMPLTSVQWAFIGVMMGSFGLVGLIPKVGDGYGSLIDTLNTIHAIKARVGSTKAEFSQFIDQLPTRESAVKDAIASFTGLPSVPGTLSSLWGNPSGIRDLAPGSPFLQTYVDPKQIRTVATGNFVKTQTGVARTASVHWVHHSVWWWSWDSPEGIDWNDTPQYKYAYVRTVATYDVTTAPTPAFPTESKLPSDLPVGFIMGTNNNVDQLMRDMHYDSIRPQAMIDEKVSSLNTVVNVGTPIGLVLFITSVFWCLLGPWFLLATIAQLCFSLWLLNSIGTIRTGKDATASLIPTLLGSTTHDGLIPTGDQWRPLDGKAGIGGKPLTGNTAFPYVAFDTTHESARHDPRIWGSPVQRTGATGNPMVDPSGKAVMVGGLETYGVWVTPVINPSLPASDTNKPLVRQWIQSTFPTTRNADNSVTTAVPAGFEANKTWVGGPSFAGTE